MLTFVYDGDFVSIHILKKPAKAFCLFVETPFCHGGTKENEL